MKGSHCLKNFFSGRTDNTLRNEKPNKLNSALLGIYLFLVLIIYVFVTCFYNPPYKTSEVVLFMTSIAFLIAAVLFFICPKLLKVTGKLYVRYEPASWTRKEKIKLILSFFIPTFFVFLAVFLLFYPCSFSMDSLDQYTQAVGDTPYNDWHPVLHTLLVFTIPLKLTGGWHGSMIFFQIIEFSCVLTYMSYTLAQLGNKRLGALSLFYVIANPITWGFITFPWKDISFAIISTLLMTYAVRIYFTKGKWLDKWYRALAFAAALALATLLRHNAILFTAPLLIITLIYIGKKWRVQLTAFFIILLVLVKGPLYAVLGVQAPNNRRVEMLGLPMNVIGNVIKEKPESLDEETREFIYSITSQEIWNEYFEPGDFNTIKSLEKLGKMNLNVIENAGPMKILQVTGKCFKASPIDSLFAVFKLTDMVYAIDGPVDFEPYSFVVDNKYGVEPRFPFATTIYTKYSNAAKNSILRYPFYYVGVINLGVILIILSKYRLNRWKDWKKFLYCLPLLCYNFGTMLMLAKNDFRFFYLSFPIFPILILLLLRRENKGEDFQRE